MFFLINDKEYKDVSSKIVSNQKLHTKLWQKISFVEKYVDRVDSVFSEQVERNIAYLELGSMVYSCFETILKSVLFKMFECCEKRACKEKCGYRPCKTLKCLNNYPAIDTFRTLLNAELIRFSPREANELEMLNDLRNNIHLSKTLSDDAPDYEFDNEFVKRMLSYYYALLTQFALFPRAYDEKPVCLKEEKNNSIESNKKYNENKKKEYYQLSVLAVLRFLFLKCELFKREEWILKTLYKSIDSGVLANCIYFTFDLNKYLFKTEIELTTAKNDFFKSLSKYMKEDYMNNVFADYNKVKENYERKI